LIATQDLNSKEGLNISKNINYKENFEVLSKFENRLGPNDLIQIKGCSNSQARFDLKDFPNLERCKPFQNRKWKFGRRIQIQIFSFKPRIF
jgi:hypothetical protein